MPYPASTRREMLSAGKRLARREAVMRTALQTHQPEPVCVSACVDFFRDAVTLGYSVSVDELADVLDEDGIEHGLGPRTLDQVFESGEISDAVVLELVRLFDEDPAFHKAMIDQDWHTSVDLWRPTPGPATTESTAPCERTPDPLLAASAAPTFPLQGDLFAAHL